MKIKLFLFMLLFVFLNINIITNAIDLSKYEEYADDEIVDYTKDYNFYEHIKLYGSSCSFDKYIKNNYIESIYNKIDEYRKLTEELPCIQGLRLSREDKGLNCSSEEITKVNNMSFDEQKVILEDYREISEKISLEFKKINPFIIKCKSEKFNYIKDYVKNNEVIIKKLQIIIEKEYKKSPKRISGLLNVIDDKEELIKNKDYDKFLLIQQLKRMCKEAIRNNGKVQNIYDSLNDWDIDEYL